MLKAMICALALAAPPLAAADLTPQQLALLAGADIVILGEDHDNPHHHEGQGALLRRIAPAAVVFEMLTPEMARRVTDRGDMPLAALGEAIGWEAAGWPPITLYAPVFEALGDRPVIGAALPRGEVRRAFEEGAAAVFGTDAPSFGLDQPLPPAEQAAREEMQFEVHCQAMPREMMGGMVEAQRLRDAYFARATLAALDRHGAPVAVITGNGHARRDWGMPASLARAAPQVTVVSVGFAAAQPAAGEAVYDITLLAPPVERDDPCAAFDR